MHHFLNGWPARTEDMEKIQSDLGLPTNRFLKHVSSRWLTLEPAAERLLEHRVFLDFHSKETDLVIEEAWIPEGLQITCKANH